MVHLMLTEVKSIVAVEGILLCGNLTSSTNGHREAKETSIMGKTAFQ